MGLDSEGNYFFGQTPKKWYQDPDIKIRTQLRTKLNAIRRGRYSGKVDEEKIKRLLYAEKVWDESLQERKAKTGSIVSYPYRKSSFKSSVSSTDFAPIPKTISGKRITIRVNSKFLTNKDALEEAVKAGLLNLAESIVADVTYKRQANYGDYSGMDTIKDYGSKSAYYSSGMIPHWRGGLIGSFKILESQTPMKITMGFTAKYAGLIEKGNTDTVKVPSDWAEYKLGRREDLELHGTNPHPFAGEVASKISKNLINYGYLDAFLEKFCVSFK